MTSGGSIGAGGGTWGQGHGRVGAILTLSGLMRLGLPTQAYWRWGWGAVWTIKAKLSMPEETPQNWKRIVSNVVNHTITNHYKRDPRQVRSSWTRCMKKLVLVTQLTNTVPRWKTSLFFYPTNLISFLVDDDDNFTGIKVFMFISA